MVVIAGCIIVRDNKILMVKELRVKSYYQHADGMRNLTSIKKPEQ